MKIVKVRVNKTIEYDVSVPVEDYYTKSEVTDYIRTINWDREIEMSPQNYKHIAEYFDWLDWSEDNGY